MLMMGQDTEVQAGLLPEVGELVCQGCGRELAHVYDYDGRTALYLIGLNAADTYVLRAEVKCPGCAATRSFFSVPMSAIRLGIAGGSDG